MALTKTPSAWITDYQAAFGLIASHLDEPAKVQVLPVGTGATYLLVATWYMGLTSVSLFGRTDDDRLTALNLSSSNATAWIWSSVQAPDAMLSSLILGAIAGIHFVT